MRVYAKTDIGYQRTNNEDAYYTPEGKERFCLVADGMGGHNAGEVASGIAATAVANVMRSSAHISCELMREAIARANELIYKDALAHPERSGMGTTVSLFGAEGEYAYFGQVGDSRIYRIREGLIKQVTEDHSYVNELVRAGAITPEEARTHPRRNIITRAVGTQPQAEVDAIRLRRKPGDVYFLCTDGLSNELTDEDILILSQTRLSWEDKLQGMIDLVLEKGGADNITAMFAIPEEDD